jgi:hypothetical protein
LKAITRKNRIAFTRVPSTVLQIKSWFDDTDFARLKESPDVRTLDDERSRFDQATKLSATNDFDWEPND